MRRLVSVLAVICMADQAEGDDLYGGAGGSDLSGGPSGVLQVLDGGEWLDGGENQFASEPEPEPAHHIRPECQPAMLEEEAIRAQDADAHAYALEVAAHGGLKPPPPPPPGPPCESFLNKTTCPERCFWYPHKKLCRTYAAPQPPCDCPAYQHCKPAAGKGYSVKNCLSPFNTCPERCVWNRERMKCSLTPMPPPPGQIDTSNKGVVALTGLFLLVLAGIGVIIGFMIKWIEKQENKARMMSLPRPIDPNADLIVPLNEDGIDEGGEREYRRADGEYRKGRDAGAE